MIVTSENERLLISNMQVVLNRSDWNFQSGSLRRSTTEWFETAECSSCVFKQELAKDFSKITDLRLADLYDEKQFGLLIRTPQLQSSGRHPICAYDFSCGLVDRISEEFQSPLDSNWQRRRRKRREKSEWIGQLACNASNSWWDSKGTELYWMLLNSIGESECCSFYFSAPM